MTVGAITNLLVNRLKHPLLSAFHILMWSEKWLIIGRHILYLCPPKQFKYKSSLRVFWLPVCQCTGNIFPSFKVILLGHCHIWALSVHFSLCMLALEGFLQSWVSNFSFPSPVIMLKRTQVCWQGPPARDGSHTTGTPRGTPVTAKPEVRSQEGKPEGGKQESELMTDAPSRKITELFVLEELLKIT